MKLAEVPEKLDVEMFKSPEYIFIASDKGRQLYAVLNHLESKLLHGCVKFIDGEFVHKEFDKLEDAIEFYNKDQ